MSLSNDIYTLGQLMADNLNEMGVDDADVNDGLTTLANKILDVETTKTATNLTIEVPLSLVYSDEFNITGVLTDINSNPVVNQTVQLLIGDSPVATDTTDSTGAVSFTRTPVTMGTHTFQLHYNGDTTYYATSSSTVSRDINKETTYLTVTSPSDNLTIYSDETISISGILTDNEGTAISDAEIVVSENGSTLTTLSTGSDGTYTGSISGLSVGSHVLLFRFEDTDYYTGSGLYRNIVINSQTLTVSADNPILSYKDGDSATLSATYVGGSVSGKSVTFYYASDDSVLGTGTTDNNGVATCSNSYASAGVGDIGFYAKCGTLYSDTYTVEDIFKYDSASSDKTSNYSTLNLNSFTHDTDHYVAYRSLGTSPSSTYYSPIYQSGLTLPTNYEISIDILFTATGDNIQTGFNISPTLGLQTYSGASETSVYRIGTRTMGLYYRVSGSLTRYDINISSWSSNVWYRFYMKVEGTSVTAKITNLSTDTEEMSTTQTLSNIQSWKKFNISIGGQSQTMHWKNLQIKEL